MSRVIAPPFIALLIVISLFLLMHWMVRPHGSGEGLGLNAVEGVEMVDLERDKETPEEQMAKLENAPPPPPMAPPSLTRPELPSMNAPSMAAAPIDAGPIAVPITIGGAGLSLSSSAFGGFARGGAGGTGTGGGSGYGGGKGFSGKTLIPLSTARPQMPEWACKQKIKGWVQVSFVVMPNGRVRDVKIVDADPRGVYEAAAIESVGNWIYQGTGKAREVIQKVDMDPADCAYNWQ